ncbi:MAG: hypothetical protein DME25_13280 [Verrucomicrobia bacterium]|nr:MAG: hypothetical protein DME25_13280 [Verrucomicrobiota bacterium]
MVRTDREWEVSLVTGTWQKAAVASDRPAVRPGNSLFGRERMNDSLRRVWPGLVVIVLVAVGIVGASGWLQGRFPSPRPSPRTGPLAPALSPSDGERGNRPAGPGLNPEIAVLVLVMISWVALFLNNLPQLPGLLGFDRDGHLYYIDYILHNKGRHFITCSPP